MKISAILTITVACLLLSFQGLTQDASVTFSQDNASLSTILAAIQKQTGFTSVIDNNLMKQARKVSLHVTNMPLRQVLELCFKEQPFDYEIVGQMITLVPGKKAVITKIQPPNWLTIRGKVTNETGAPVAGATITAKNSDRQTASRENGDFSLTNILENDSIYISYVGYETEKIRVQGTYFLLIELKSVIAELSYVIVSNGYQKQNVTKTTGSFGKVDNILFNRRVSTNVLDRLDGVTSGMLFNKNIQGGTKQSNISIRGRSTIYANPEPLIILDNFPYTGDVANINPNDVESVTILKDAAAASIWGAFAANGVMVITTKTGKYNQPLKLSFNSNITIGAKPDVYYQPTLGSADFITSERFLFDNGFYNDRETNPLHPPLSPAVEIMIKERDGLLSHSNAESMLNVLRGRDSRKDLEKYLYRQSINQQYAINATGGGIYNQYYFSAGYDKNLSNQTGNQNERITINANNTYAWLNKKLELSTGIIFSATKTKDNTELGISPLKYPYALMADQEGKALSIVNSYRQSYIDTAGQGKLLDWQYRPLDELRLANNTTNVTDYRINVGLRYAIFRDLNVNLLYQYNRGLSVYRGLHSVESYFTRDLINQYTQINGNTVTRPIPLGDILDKRDLSYEAHNFRSQLSYNHAWGTDHSLNALAGGEIRSFDNESNTSTLYGYNNDRQSFSVVDYATDFPMYQSPAVIKKIPYYDKSRGTKDRYISYYGNMAYTFKQRYTLSASARKDESNIFGVKTNQKGVPLWSAGISWEISKEDFYKGTNWLPFLKLRVTNGYNGNVDRSVSAYTTALIESQNSWLATIGTIINPPNPALRWEKVHMVNLGVDFGSLSNRITGSLEYYFRDASDLIGDSPLDPTTGNSNLRGNTANMKGRGIDVVLNTQNTTGKILWTSNILFSHTRDKVTKYKTQQSSIQGYLNSEFFKPLEGKTLYAINSLDWKGLDPLTGDPQGLLNNNITTSYGAIFSSTDFTNLKYRGAQNPTFFGSLRNNLNWKQLQFSFNITWKAGYYFRAPSVNYYDLFNEKSKGHTDFIKRWQKPGDETSTNVPSIKYVTDNNRDYFYKYSSVLVERGDHIRLQDIQLSYTIGPKQLNNFPIQGLRFYAYANNLGIIWKATSKSIDPDYISSFPASRSIAVGVNIDFK